MKTKGELKIWIAAMVFIALMVLVLPLSVSAQVEASGLPFGTQVGEYNSVAAYSNYENDYVSDEYNYVDDYNTGMKWQCVEYVNRYYYIVYGLEIRMPGTNADDYYDSASDRGLIAYPNGSTTSPQPGDILCSNGGTLGHVAIVREVTGDSVHVIHQNWANTEADNDKTISMSVSDGHYTVSGFSGSYPVQGWLRKPAEVIYVPDDYAKIQWAVDNATAGDIIIVRDGIYNENVEVNKRLTIKSENGSALTIIQAKNSNDHVFEITADYVNISGFTVTGATGYTGWYNYKAGIYLIEVEYCNITCTNASNNYYGICLDNSSNNNITNNNELNNWTGIYLEYSSNNMLLGNNASSNEYGIMIRHLSNNNTITENTANENNVGGIYLSCSGNNTITNNNASSNLYGISLYSSNKTAIINNDASNNSFCGIGLEKSNNNTIINNNANENNEFGIWIRHSSNNNTITENNANENNDEGIRLSYSDNNILINNNASNNNYGIYLSSSSNNNITSNIASNNDDKGISLSSSSNNLIKNNAASNNEFGISLWFSCDNNTIIENNASVNSYFGIYLFNSSNNNFTKNSVNSSSAFGIYLINSSNNIFTKNNVNSEAAYGFELRYSSNNTITNNTFIEGGLYVFHSYQHIVENNTVNGKTLAYLEDKSDQEITDAGQVILVNCNNITVKNLDLSHTLVGIELWETNNSKIANNNASNNKYGIMLYFSNNTAIINNDASNNTYTGIRLDYLSNSNVIANNNVSSNGAQGIELYYSSNNTIANNTASNNLDGIYLDYSDDNFIYLNNFINNTDNVESWDSTNIWNSTSSITYTYNGKTYTNYTGNYWSDYIFEGNDTNGDGIGDSPYSIDSDEDKYPLMEPWENYFKPPEEKIFDTGSPANPYPSIMGNHTGTIKPNHTVIATKLYTYPCAGTGGHTEYAKIGNKTWNATATWEGYAGDWHNITFDKTVVLLAGESYDYTIRTGSYPQIIHESPFNATGGEITCTKFTDVNGKVYYDWIPAIKLFL